MAVRLEHGDCREVLATLPAESIEACVTDPPYGIGFMGRDWDRLDATCAETWLEVARVLKPGAHLAAFGGTRTFHRMMCAIEDAGFEIRDTLMWVYGSGFPKSLNLPGGLGTALKPAWEPIVLARKPLAGTVAANIAKHGTGALNIDGCRVGTEGGSTIPSGMDRLNAANAAQGYRPGTYQQGTPEAPEPAGRWPANVCHDGSPEVLAAFAAFGSSASGVQNGDRGTGGIWTPSSGKPCGPQYGDTGTAARFFYTAKASREEREGNHHPTVKPLALMQWLCRLVTLPGGTVLDPFAGSGSTLVAADREGFHGIGIEMDAEYVEIARRRFTGDCPLFAEVA